MSRPMPVDLPPGVEAEHNGRREASASHADASSSSSLSSRPGAATLSTRQSDLPAPDKEQVQLQSAGTIQHHVITAPIIEGEASNRLDIVVTADENNGVRETTASPQPMPASPGIQCEEGKGELLVEKERFPMGSCETTLYESGWLDIACGPCITIDVDYTSHNHQPGPGEHTPLLPNVLCVDIDAPVVLVRVFGCLARDLLGLKVRHSWFYKNLTYVSCVITFFCRRTIQVNISR